MKDLFNSKRNYFLIFIIIIFFILYYTTSNEKFATYSDIMNNIGTPPSQLMNSIPTPPFELMNSMPTPDWNTNSSRMSPTMSPTMSSLKMSVPTTTPIIKNKLIEGINILNDSSNNLEIINKVTIDDKDIVYVVDNITNRILQIDNNNNIKTINTNMSNIPCLMNSVSPDGNSLYLYLANRELIVIKNPGGSETIKSLNNNLVDKDNHDIISIAADNNELYITAFSRINNSTILYNVNESGNNLIKIPDDIKFIPIDIFIKNNKIYILNNNATIDVYDIQNKNFILSNISINENLNENQYQSITVDSKENIYIINNLLNIVLMIINLGMSNQIVLPLSITYNLQLNGVTSNNNGKLYVTNNYNKKLYTYEYSSFFKKGISNILETINNNLNSNLTKLLSGLQTSASQAPTLLSEDSKNQIITNILNMTLQNDTLKNNIKYDAERILNKLLLNN
jgi:hypothetical protein